MLVIMVVVVPMSVVLAMLMAFILLVLVSIGLVGFVFDILHATNGALAGLGTAAALTMHGAYISRSVFRAGFFGSLLSSFGSMLMAVLTSAGAGSKAKGKQHSKERDNRKKNGLFHVFEFIEMNEK